MNVSNLNLTIKKIKFCNDDIKSDIKVIKFLIPFAYILMAMFLISLDVMNNIALSGLVITFLFFIFSLIQSHCYDCKSKAEKAELLYIEEITKLKKHQDN
ncbi:hypothetical protein CRI87_12370 [Liquorilactobacillus satsumensis]|nr:hypothetical protein [Liquorilactobacillus satsumensis]